MHLPRIRLYRKLRHRKGFGIHSPFVYSLITKVIEEKSSFYAFEEIENFRKSLLIRGDEIGRITAAETQSANYGAFLFRIVNFFKCRNVIQLGSSTGVMGLYLSMASRTQTDCYLLEERPGLLQSVSEFALAHHLQKLYCIEGDYRANLEKLYSRLPEADLIVVNHLPADRDTAELVRLCKNFIGRKSILILNNISRNKEMKKLWHSVKDNPHARVVMDLYSLGLVFFNDKLPKRYYKAYFNDRKKQNLHKNGRRRIYFFGRRKKGIKNTSPH